MTDERKIRDRSYLEFVWYSIKVIWFIRAVLKRKVAVNTVDFDPNDPDSRFNLFFFEEEVSGAVVALYHGLTNNNVYTRYKYYLRRALPYLPRKWAIWYALKRVYAPFNLLHQYYYWSKNLSESYLHYNNYWSYLAIKGSSYEPLITYIDYLVKEKKKAPQNLGSPSCPPKTRNLSTYNKKVSKKQYNYMVVVKEKEHCLDILHECCHYVSGQWSANSLADIYFFTNPKDTVWLKTVWPSELEIIPCE